MPLLFGLSYVESIENSSLQETTQRLTKKFRNTNRVCELHAWISRGWASATETGFTPGMRLNKQKRCAPGFRVSTRSGAMTTQSH